MYSVQEIVKCVVQSKTVVYVKRVSLVTVCILYIGFFEVKQFCCFRGLAHNLENLATLYS